MCGSSRTAILRGTQPLGHNDALVINIRSARPWVDQGIVCEHHHLMKQPPFGRRLAVWLGTAVLLAVGTAAVGSLAGADAGWSLGAIVAAVYSGTLIFLQQDRKDRGQDDQQPKVKKVGLDMNQAWESEPKDSQGTPQETFDYSAVGQTWPESTNYSWNPALNQIEDVLVAQVSEPTIIINIVEQVGMNPGIMPRGQGSAATIWHGVLRSAWMTGGQELVCEILSIAHKLEPSRELRKLIYTRCGQRQ